MTNPNILSDWPFIDIPKTSYICAMFHFFSVTHIYKNLIKKKKKQQQQPKKAPFFLLFHINNYHGVCQGP
jgi:hypothetical protein